MALTSPVSQYPNPSYYPHVHSVGTTVARADPANPVLSGSAALYKALCRQELVRGD